MVRVVVTAGDETSAYLVSDALVERFPGADPPVFRPAPPGLVSFAVPAPTPCPLDR